MTDPTGPWASADRDRRRGLEGERPCRRRLPRRRSRGSARRTRCSAPIPTSPPSGRSPGCRGGRGRGGGAAGRAARRRAVRGQEPLRRRRPADAGRVADQPRAGAGGGRCGAGAADGGGGRGPARHAQHGRIRLRLHRRERPRRRLPQPARPGPDERRLVVGLRRGDGGGAGAGLARLGHQRLAPGAGLALRRLQPEADLRPAAADRDVPLRRQPRPSRALRPHRARPRRSPTTRCRGRTPAIPAARGARRSRRRRGSGRRDATARRRCSAAGSTRTPARRRGPRSPGSPTRWRPTPRSDTLRLDEAEAGRAAAYLITNAESADFHLRRLRARAADFDPDTRDRFLAGALLPAAWVARARRVRHWWLGTGARRLPALRPAGGAGDALPGSGRGGEDAGACRPQPPAPTEPRPSRDAVLLHRPAGRHRAAVRRPTRCRSACSSSRAHGASMSACRRRTCLEQAGAAVACPPVASRFRRPRPTPDERAGT